MIAVWIKSEETVWGEVANQTSGVPKPPALGSRLSALIKELSESEESRGAEGCLWTSSGIYSHPSRKICRGLIGHEPGRNACQIRPLLNHSSWWQGALRAGTYGNCYTFFFFFTCMHLLTAFLCAPVLSCFFFSLDLMILHFFLHDKQKCPISVWKMQNYC